MKTSGIIGILIISLTIFNSCDFIWDCIDGNGIKPIKDATTPLNAKGLLKSVACFERLAVEAVLAPDESSILKALMSHPSVRSYSVAKKSLPYLMKQVMV